VRIAHHFQSLLVAKSFRRYAVRTLLGSIHVPFVHFLEVLKTRFTDPISFLVIGPPLVLDVWAINVRYFLPAEFAMVVIPMWAGSRPFLQEPLILAIEGWFLAKIQSPVIFLNRHRSGLESLT